ncbi:hypothetical protein Leryth_007683 [Lithospermum erythrorhizon]|nr:hypothetical protein Leryth_007683 [Lithospermum erythrorhizon]
MVKSVENGVSVAPFLVKCYEMVDAESTNELISWNSSNNNSFIIWDDSRFSAELLPKYFKHNNFASFVRQLNIYGFRKIDTDRYEFTNDGFVRGQKQLLKSIVRRRQPQIQGQKPAKNETAVSSTSEEDKRKALRKEVEILKTDKNALMQELINLRNHQKTSHSKMILLRDQLKGMEKNQQQMLSFIVMAMQNPGFLAQLFQPKENNWRMAESGSTILTPVKDECEAELADRAIVRYHPSINESSDPCTTFPQLSSDNPMEWDISVEEWKELLANIDLTPGPGDETLSSHENYGQLVLPDAPENDILMEQLLASPTAQPGHHFGTFTDTDMEMSSILQPKEYEDSNNADEEDNNNQCTNMEDVDSENYGISDSIDFSVAELELIDSLSKI